MTNKIGCGIALLIASLGIGSIGRYFWIAAIEERHDVQQFTVPQKMTYEEFVAAGPPQKGRYRITGCLINLSEAGGNIAKIGDVETTFTSIDAPVVGQSNPDKLPYQFLVETRDQEICYTAMQVSEHFKDRFGKEPLPKNVIVSKEGLKLLKHDVEGMVFSNNKLGAVMRSELEGTQKDTLVKNWVQIDEDKSPSMTIVVLNFVTSGVFFAIFLGMWVSFVISLFRRPSATTGTPVIPPDIQSLH